MRDLRERVALVTGASGGIGRYIARALAREGTHVAISARREEALSDLASELRGMGVRAEAVPADLADLPGIDGLIERAEAAVGPIDVLVNNAGIDVVASFARMTFEEVTSSVNVNLTSPLLLTQRVLPGMVGRGRGHVVFISSAADKFGNAYHVPYSATKAALIGANQALRGEYAGTAVGFSAICPGFTAGDGMYQRMVEEGVKSNRMLGETSVEDVAAAVVDAIRRDLPEVIVSGTPLRPLLALGELAPRLVERAAPRFGVTEIFRKTAEKRGRL